MRIVLKIFLLFALVLPLVLSSSCKRNTKIIHRVARGRILDNDTKQPLEGVTVQLRGCDHCYSTRPEPFIAALGQSITGGDGRFEIYYSMPEDGYMLGLEYTKEGYHSYKDVALYDPKWETIEGIEFILSPYNYLKVHIRNQNPIDGEDSLMIYQWFSRDRFFLKGMNIDTVVYFKTITEEGHDMTWEVYKDGNKITYYDHKTCSRLDTCEYDINY